jgi:hypothetical protein
MLHVTKVLRRAVVAALVACSLSAGAARAVTFVPDTGLNNGYMNVFDLSYNYIFGSGWGTADLCANYGGGNWTLSPNTIGDPNPFWYSPSGGPGSTGQKIMDANLYAQFDGTYAGQSMTFSGNVVSNTLAASHFAFVFIRDFAPDFSSMVETKIPMPASGAFSITQAMINDPARHQQYGFQMVGPCVWYTDVAPYGNVVVGAPQVTPTQKSSWGRIKSMFR